MLSDIKQEKVFHAQELTQRISMLGRGESAPPHILVLNDFDVGGVSFTPKAELERSLCPDPLSFVPGKDSFRLEVVGCDLESIDLDKLVEALVYRKIRAVPVESAPAVELRSFVAQFKQRRVDRRWHIYIGDGKWLFALLEFGGNINSGDTVIATGFRSKGMVDDEICVAEADLPRWDAIKDKLLAEESIERVTEN